MEVLKDKLTAEEWKHLGEDASALWEEGTLNTKAFEDTIAFQRKQLEEDRAKDVAAGREPSNKPVCGDCHLIAVKLGMKGARVEVNDDQV